MNQLIPYDPPKLLTEREVRVAGVVSSRRASIRSILNSHRLAGVSLSVQTESHTVLNLPQNDAEAVLALLLERDEQFLTALNIELEP